MTARLVTIYWRDIPTQVNAQSGRTRHRAPLSRRFMTAVGKAATVAGIHTAHEYTLEWRRESQPCSDDLEAEATAEAARIDAAFTRQRLAAAVAGGGFENRSGPGPN